MLALHSPAARYTPATLTQPSPLHTCPTLPPPPQQHALICTHACTATPTPTSTLHSHVLLCSKRIQLCAGYERRLWTQTKQYVMHAGSALTSWAAQSCFLSSSFFPKTQVPRYSLALPLKRVTLASHLTHLALLFPHDKSRATAASLERALQLSAACDSTSALDYLLMGSRDSGERIPQKRRSEI